MRSAVGAREHRRGTSVRPRLGVGRAGAGLLGGLFALLLLLAGACGSAENDAAPAVARSEVVPLSVGCNEVALTWPAETPLGTVLAAVSRPDGVQALWLYDSEAARYQPVGPDDAANVTTRQSPDRAVICTTVASVLTRPRGTGREAAVARLVPPPSTESNATAASSTVAPPQVSAPQATPAPGGAATSTATSAASPAPTAADAGPRAPFVTLPPGSRLPTEAECAAAVPRLGWEPRPENRGANQTRGGSLPAATLPGIDYQRVSGNFTGTTDEIMQWGACKWGLDADLVRSIAVQESWWRQAAVGDHGTSFGLLQVKPAAHPGTFPLVRDSTAFNVDYMLAWLRGCYDGNYAHWLPAEARGDIWGCIGTWYAGEWKTAGARSYIALLQGHFGQKRWLRPDF